MTSAVKQHNLWAPSPCLLWGGIAAAPHLRAVQVQNTHALGQIEKSCDDVTDGSLPLYSQGFPPYSLPPRSLITFIFGLLFKHVK